MTRASDLARLMGAGGTLNAALSVDTISEKTSGSGVTIDSLNIKDSGIGGHQIGGRRNILINGAMQVAQRGTSLSIAHDGTTQGYLVDRFRISFANTDQIDGTFTQVADHPISANGKSLKWTTGTAESAIDSNEYLYFAQIIEAQNLQHLNYGNSNAKTTTLSFYVKSSITGTYAVGLYKADSTVRIHNQTYTISSANTWEKKTVTFVGDTDSSAGIVNDNGMGFYVSWHLAAGTGYTSSDATSGWVDYAATKWANGQGTNAVATTAGATWQMTECQFEVGSQATPFEHRSFGEELALCQRYFQYHVSTSTAARYYADQYSSGTLVLDQHHSPMRAVASGTVIGTWIISNITGQPSLYVGTEFSHYLARSVSSTGRAYFYAGQNDGVSLDAELQDKKMNITKAKYRNNAIVEGTELLNIIATIDSVEMVVPLDPDNRHYAEILKQVEEGTLTIEEAD